MTFIRTEIDDCDEDYTPAMTYGIPSEHQTEFNIWLLTYPSEHKLLIIKLIREVTGQDLKTAKNMSEKLPSLILSGLSNKHAEHIQNQFKTLQAQTLIK